MCKLQCVEICTLLKKIMVGHGWSFFGCKSTKTLIGHRKMTKSNRDFFNKV